MRKYSHIIVCHLLLLLLAGCEAKWDFAAPEEKSQIAVEGWIENGHFPQVLLTKSKALKDIVGETDISDIAIRWAKVTVSDGTQNEILTGRVNTDYMPPFIYTGNKIRGEVGKTYTLTVEYSGEILTANTHIPAPVAIERVEVSKCEDNDTLYQIKAYFLDEKNTKNYYKIFTRTLPDDSRFYAPFLGTFNDNVFVGTGESSIYIYRGVHLISEKTYTPFYKEDETVEIKFTQIPETGFAFWSSYEEEVTNNKNPLFPNIKNVRGNINGGLGIWCGYGINKYTVSIKDAMQ